MGPKIPTEEYFQNGQWGYDGSQWRKLPMLFGFSGRWVEQLVNLSASPGTNTLTTAVVPAGYIYRLDMCGLVDVDSAASVTQHVTGSGIGVTFVPSVAMAAGAWKITFPVGIWLAAGDSLTGTFYGCVANDDLYMRAWGVKMAVT